MPRYVNQAFFDDPSAKARAEAGIVKPMRRVIAAGTLLFRYGNDAESATRGSWWLDLRQRTRVNEWAALHGIEVPLAVRIMSAVMHEWEPTDPTKPAPRSTMEMLARATVRRALLAYEGESRPQVKRTGGTVDARIGPATLDPPMTQLFVPGLHNDMLCRDALDYDAILAVKAGSSALFGQDGAITAIH